KPDGSFRIGGLVAGTVGFSIGSWSSTGNARPIPISRIERDGVVQPNALQIQTGEYISGIRVVAAYASGSIRGVVKMENGTLPMKQYHDVLRSILDNGTPHQDRTGVGTISHFGFQTRFDLRAGFPLVTTMRVPFRWIAEELFWFLSGDTNEANLRARGVDIWKEWADAEHTRRFGREPGDLGPVYGYLWRSFGGHYPERDGVDQIARLIDQIESNPNSRRLVVSGWDPRECDNVDLPPCHTLFQFKVEQNRALDGRATAPLLHCQLYQRSADAFLGVPF